jgi:hypothetical protein
MDALVREAFGAILTDKPDWAEPKSDPRPIWEVIAGNMKDVPPED